MKGKFQSIDHHVSDDGIFRFTIKSSSYYTYTVYIPVNKYPSGNCQMFIIKVFQDLINLEYEQEDMLVVLKYIFETVGKSFALIDIKESIYQKFLKLDILKEENTLFNTPYKSTNNSEMRIIGFHLGLKK